MRIPEENGKKQRHATPSLPIVQISEDSKVPYHIISFPQIEEDRSKVLVHDDGISEMLFKLN